MATPETNFGIWGQGQVAPSPDCIEISVFGVGVGESILVHLGAEHWVVVDSCREPVGKHPAVLDYLQAIGVSPQRIDACVCTHFHSDHTDGLSEILAKATSARFFVPDALLSEEMRIVAAFLRGDQASSVALPGSLSEFWKVLQVLEERHGNTPSFAFAVPDRLMSHTPVGASAFSLSPSDAANLVAKLKIATLVPKPGTYRRLPSIGGPNDTAVAMWVSDGSRHVLLGSDLENHSDRSMGWGAAQQCVCVGGNRATVFKVAHHGSSTADDPAVWASMTRQGEVISLLTAYTRSDLPGQSDILRIKTKSGSAFCTTVPKSTVVRDSAVNKTLREAGVRIRSMNGQLGHIRVRWLPNADPTIDLFGASTSL